MYMSQMPWVTSSPGEAVLKVHMVQSSVLDPYIGKGFEKLILLFI